MASDKDSKKGRLAGSWGRDSRGTSSPEPESSKKAPSRTKGPAPKAPKKPAKSGDKD